MDVACGQNERSGTVSSIQSRELLPFEGRHEVASSRNQEVESILLPGLQWLMVHLQADSSCSCL